MNITTIELRKLTSSSGMVLTNGESYGKEIYLGKNDSPENWREISEEEYERIMEEEEKRLENNVT
jgi:hypothetical protein